jgi:hypothetical protein
MAGRRKLFASLADVVSFLLCVVQPVTRTTYVNLCRQTMADIGFFLTAGSTTGLKLHKGCLDLTPSQMGYVMLIWHSSHGSVTATLLLESGLANSLSYAGMHMKTHLWPAAIILA